MQESFFSPFLNQLAPGISTTLAYTGPKSGAFSGGVLSSIGFFIWLLFIGLVVVWVALTFWAAIKIISGYNNQQEAEKGIKIIRNIWFGISAFMIFVIIISIIGSFLGFGSVNDWSLNLRQCGTNNQFYFVSAENKLLDLQDKDAKSAEVYCCEKDIPDPGNPSLPYYDSGWVVWDPGSISIQPPVPECELVKEVDFN